MKFLKFYIIFILVVCTSIISSAQDIEITKSLYKLIRVDNSLFFTDEYFEKGFVFSLQMEINSKGRVDSVTFSHFRNDELMKLVNFDKIKIGLMENKKDFKKYKNEIVIVIVFIMRGDYGITKLNNGKQIRENWINIINTMRLYPNRKQILLAPLLISSEGKTISN